MTEVSLAWLLQKVDAPVMGVTKTSHVDGAVKAVELELTQEETDYRLDEFGGMIVGSPVYYGGPNGRLTSFLERLNQYFLMTNMHVVSFQ